MQNRSYVYRHIRLDTNEVFYVGIGSKPDRFRAYEKGKRNSHWHNFVKKVGYQVEIVYDGLSWETACVKEIELIAQYGRLDLKTGSIINLTNGGDGAVGLIRTDEHLANGSCLFC